MNKINKSGLQLLVLGTFFLTLILIVSGCSGEGKYEVLYEVTGDAAFVSYFDPDGEQYDGSPPIPWSYSFTTDDENQTISLRAGSRVEMVYVKMYVNGDLVASDSEDDGLIAMTGTYTISDFVQP